MFHTAKTKGRLTSEPRTGNRCPRLLRLARAFIVLAIGMVITIVTAASFFPELAAQNVDRLRNIIGDAPVAQLEGVVFSIQDYVQHSEYQLGILKPAIPWVSPTMNVTTPVITPIASRQVQAVSVVPSPSMRVAILPSALPTILSPNPTLTTSIAPMASSESLLSLSALPPEAQASSTPVGIVSIFATTGPIVSTTTPILLPSSVLPSWQLSALTPLGKLPGEGQWSPYLQTVSGQVPIAYRTFLQPDPQRPYAVPAIVAINLLATHLHYILGTIDPAPATPQPLRTGLIPAVDMQPGVLLATFNGGFKARHGRYGAMSDGLIALPAINGLATVAIYANGQIKIGEWGADIKNAPDLVSWRQNGKMLIHNGQINPATMVSSSSWGLTIDGGAITWRSALGISADGHTLYYVAGPHLDASTLAKAIAQTGAVEALQLDINYTLVHFTAIHSNGSSVVAEPLLNEMTQKIDRYLKPSTDDFFYVTLAAQPSQ